MSRVKIIVICLSLIFLDWSFKVSEKPSKFTVGVRVVIVVSVIFFFFAICFFIVKFFFFFSHSCPRSLYNYADTKSPHILNENADLMSTWSTAISGHTNFPYIFSKLTNKIFEVVFACLQGGRKYRDSFPLRSKKTPNCLSITHLVTASL